MRIAVLGCSRGLGAELIQLIQKEQSVSALLLSARTRKALEEIANPQDFVTEADFTQESGQEKVITAIQDFKPTHVVYVAGGGPFGPYADKKWRDHEWAWALNFVFPARLLHSLLSRKLDLTEMKGFIVVGSQIAGRKADPMAASYAAAKHAMVGLITSVQLENLPFKVDLFEPGYMDTAMLPGNAWPRQQGLAKPASEEAQRLWQLLLN